MMAQCKFCNTAMEVAERYENDSRICDCPVCGKYILTDTAYESQLKCSQGKTRDSDHFSKINSRRLYFTGL